jgi:hypothetical protein
MANILTHLRPKYYILATSDSGEKNFPRFFNVTFIGEKLISKNYLNSAPTSFSFEHSPKNQQKSENDFGKVSEVEKDSSYTKMLCILKFL